jgi:hypothetical protein
MSGTVNQAMASRAMHGRTQEHVMRRRDAAGGEMAMLAKIVNDPSPDPKEVQDYIAELLRKGHISAQEAGQLLASMPRDPGALRSWARVMFSAVMHEGIHAHAAFPRQLYPSPQQAPGSPAAPVAGNAGNTAN